MYVNPWQISLETLIGAAPLLGHALEDRSAIRQAQDWSLLKRVRESSAQPLRHSDRADLFTVAPLDVLVTQDQDLKSFHLIEINGTGIGGLTNLTGDAVSAVLEGFFETARRLPGPAPLILVASSGKENDQAPRLNKLVHEKILYAEALKRGLDDSGRPAQVLTMPHVSNHPEALAGHQPAIVLGYMKDFLDRLRLASDGGLTLEGRPVSALVNDRFCLNVHHHFHGLVDWSRVWTMNRGFLAGADKGIAYGLLNDFVKHHPDPVWQPVRFERVHERAELLDAVLTWIRRGRRAVIKPQGTGLGHGIEFFLSADESAADVAARIDRSLRLTEDFYHLPGGAFPYTVCEFLDTCAVTGTHPLAGHKFELRIVVYRDGRALRAFPAIAKVASAKYDAAHPQRLSLINNITASAQAKQASGVDFMLPLANRQTLDLLDISFPMLENACQAATRFMAYVLDQVHDRPQVFTLPEAAGRQAFLAV